MEEMAQLLNSSLPPAEFHREFLAKVLSVSKADGGAIWIRNPQDDWELQFQSNLCDLGLDESPGGTACHGLLLRQAGTRAKASWIPPNSGTVDRSGIKSAVNPTRHALLFAPITTEKQPVGVIEIWRKTSPEHNDRRQMARLLTDMAAFEAAYLHKNQWKGLLEHQKLLSQLESFTRQIHGSLDVQEVAYFLANDCRRFLRCDQVSVLCQKGKTTCVEAVSGSPGFDKQSRLVQSMQRLATAVLAWGEKLVFRGTHSEDWPAGVQVALDAYLTESNSRFLLVLPLEDARDKAQPRSNMWTLFIESFEPSFKEEEIVDALDLFVPHATSALYNAGQFRRLPLRIWLWRLVHMRDGLRARKLLKLGTIFGHAPHC